jgi:hypothetical protein
MPQHKVFIEMPPSREIGLSDVVFKVYSDDELYGTITISKGAIEWFPSRAVKPYKMRWEKFDRVITGNVRRRKLLRE